MKTIIALIFLGVTFSSRSYSYNKYDLVTDDTTKIIESIREQYKNVNANQTKYRLLEKDLTGESTEGGFIAAFDDKQSFRKLIVTYYGETGKAIKEYYFNHNDLFFAFVKEYHYDKPVDQPGSKVASVKENRYYFFNKKLIRWVQGSGLQNPNTVAYKEEAINLLSQSKRLLSSISNCNSVPRKTLIQDTVRCKYGSDCPLTGYILKGSRNSCGEAMHVSPKNIKVPLEQ